MVTLTQGEDGTSQSVAMLLKKWDSASESAQPACKQQNGHTTHHQRKADTAGGPNGSPNGVSNAPKAAADVHGHTPINACPFRHGSVGVKPFPVRVAAGPRCCT